MMCNHRRKGTMNKCNNQEKTVSGIIKVPNEKGVRMIEITVGLTGVI